jgi:hypothetical protein
MINSSPCLSSGLNESTGELLAVKQLSLAEGTKAEVVLLRKEIQVMWDLSHENIVRYSLD